jgi:hypothetical protein
MRCGQHRPCPAGVRTAVIVDTAPTAVEKRARWVFIFGNDLINRDRPPEAPVEP